MRIAKIPPRAQGVLLALVAAVAIGVDPLGTKFQTIAGSEFWAFYFWRSIVLSTFGMCTSAFNAGSLPNFIAGVRAVGRMLPVLALLMAGIETFMVLGLANTSAAKCLLLFSLNPLWAAALSLFFLKERLRPVTAAALVMSLVSVGIVFIPPAVNAGASVEAGAQVRSVRAVEHRCDLGVPRVHEDVDAAGRLIGTHDVLNVRSTAQLDEPRAALVAAPQRRAR